METPPSLPNHQESSINLEARRGNYNPQQFHLSPLGSYFKSHLMSRSSRSRSKGTATASSRSTIANFVQPVILNSTFRFSLLRIICVSALMSSFMALPTCVMVFKEGIDGWRRVSLLAVIGPFIIFVHHFASAFGPRSTLPGILDVLLLLVEAAASGFGAITSWSLPIGASVNESLSYFALLCILTLCLFLYLLMRLVETVKRSGRNLWMITDISETRWSRADDSPSVSSGHLTARPSSRRRSGRDVLSGTSIWKARCAGEAKWLIVPRGILAALILIVVAIFALFNLVLAPVIEGSMIPTKELRAYVDSPVSNNLPIFNAFFEFTTVPINVVINAEFDNFSIPAIQEGIKVRGILAPDTSSYTSSPADPNCHIIDSEEYGGVVTFGCGDYCNWWYNDILITVNFTSFPVQSRGRTHLSRQSILVRLGFTNDTQKTLIHTRSSLLAPGIDLIGISRTRIQQTFKNRAFSTFGLFDATESFFVSEMEVFSDPMASRGAETASIRIHFETLFSSGVMRIVQDYRENSVLVGFSKVGGLWVFLGNLFVILFGCSILRTILGIKPLSVFGLVHSFREKDIREACAVEYPRLKKDMNTPPTDRGLLSFVSDQIFELNFLDKDGNKMEDEDLKADNPAQADDLENRADLNDDMTLLLQDMGDKKDFSIAPNATVRH